MVTYTDQVEIGAGNFGTVRKAFDVENRCWVAIKTLHKHHVDRADVQSVFDREAKLLAQLNHHSIPTIHAVTSLSVGGQYTSPSIVMDYIEGETLAAYLKGRGPDRSPASSSVPIVRQILDALAHAHSLGIIHRDIKPGNVIRKANGHVFVVDFGTARVLDAIDGTIVGTPAYAAPEQFLGGRIYESTDLYAVGAVLYHCLTGQPPFLGARNEVLLQHRLAPPPVPSEVDNELAPFDAIISRAMSKDPADRYQTAAEMNIDLMRAISIPADDSPVTETADLPRPQQSAVAESRGGKGRPKLTRRDHVFAWVFIGALLLALVSVLLVILGDKLPSGPTGTTRSSSTPSAESTPEPSATPMPEATTPVPLVVSTSVANHCFCEGPRGLAQIKVKVSVTNNSGEPLSVAADRIRLAYLGDAAGWSSPSPTGQLESYDGVTLIPPNTDGFAERLNGAFTFATHWAGGELAPGQGYSEPGVKRGDLVFYVPAADALTAVTGIAVIDGSGSNLQIIGFANINEWQGQADPNSF